jgi:drug/metabolite transporter (DMT)-like permease
MKRGSEPVPAEERKRSRRFLWIGGVLCGAALCLASNLQQFGIMETTPGKAAFVTALYILLVPLLGMIFLRKRLPMQIWLCVAVAVVGMYLLCVTADESGALKIGTGDIWLLLCALAFSVHILLIDYFAPRTDGVCLACLQFFVNAAISFVLMWIFETPSLPALTDVWFAVFYAGVMSCGVAYTLQIIGQKYAPSTIASLVMSLESVFAMLSDLVFYRTLPSGRESLGCLLMLVAIMVSQIPQGSLRAFFDRTRCRENK